MKNEMTEHKQSPGTLGKRVGELQGWGCWQEAFPFLILSLLSPEEGGVQVVRPEMNAVSAQEQTRCDMQL